jgi:hypothetical protein
MDRSSEGAEDQFEIELRVEQRIADQQGRLSFMLTWV